eukprot:Sdes_comp21361_c0_seq1m20001
MKKRNYRTRRVSQSEETSPENVSDVSLKDTLELQKLRSKPKGLSSFSLLSGKSINSHLVVEEPLKGKSSKKKPIKSGDDASDPSNLDNNFAVSTDRLQEDLNMLKYVEEEVSKVKGVYDTQQAGDSTTALGNDIYALPEQWALGKKEVSEDMLSTQFLSGVPEVELGIESKLRNMEATELARTQLAPKDGLKRKKALENTEAGQNFGMYRFRIDRGFAEFRRHPSEKSSSSTAPSSHLNHHEKASDDVVVERFKKRVLKL